MLTILTHTFISYMCTCDAIHPNNQTINYFFHNIQCKSQKTFLNNQVKLGLYRKLFYVKSPWFSNFVRCLITLPVLPYKLLIKNWETNLLKILCFLEMQFYLNVMYEINAIIISFDCTLCRTYLFQCVYTHRKIS